MDDGTAIHRARFVKKTEVWGDVSWALAGAVTRSEKSKPASKASSAKTSVEVPVPPVVTPAAAVPQPPAPAPIAAAPLPPAPAPAPSPEPPIAISGLVDLYWSWNFNKPSASPGQSATSVTSAALPSPTNNLRLYDIHHNQFSLSLAELTFKKTSGNLSFLMDLDFGPQADLNASTVATAAQGGPGVVMVDEVSKHVGQLIVSWNPAWAHGLVIEGGKMATHIGLEVIKSRDNWQYSRSTIFSFGIPLWHTGIHIGYPLFDGSLTLSGYLYNGWNSLWDTNQSKTPGAQIKWIPNDRWTIVYNMVSGPERAIDETDLKTVHEANITWTTTPALSLALEMAAGSEQAIALPNETKDVHWGGISLAAKYAVLSSLTLSPRIEIYRDTDGYTLGGEGQTLKGLTLTVARDWGKGLETRFELRTDQSDSPSRFLTESGTASSQTTLTFATMLTF